MKNKGVISEEVALKELEQFIYRFVKKPVAVEELAETYPDILDGIMDGYLSFDGTGLPVLKLKEPVLNDKNEVSVSEIKFRTRILPTTLADIGKGLDLKKEVLQLQLRMTAYIIDHTVVMLDKFGRYDYDIITSVSGVFS